MRLVDADDKLINLINAYASYGDACDLVDSLPTVDAVPMSVLEDIKAEIAQLKCLDEEGVFTFSSRNMKEQVLKIIDNHISGKEKTGWWMNIETEDMENVNDWFICSECGCETDEKTNYCPDCGAKN